MMEIAIPVGLASFMLALVSSLLATVSSMIMIRCAPERPAHCVATIP